MLVEIKIWAFTKYLFETLVAQVPIEIWSGTNPLMGRKQKHSYATNKQKFVFYFVWKIGHITLASWYINRFLFERGLYHGMGRMWRIMLHTLYYILLHLTIKPYFSLVGRGHFLLTLLVEMQEHADGDARRKWFEVELPAPMLAVSDSPLTLPSL